MLVCFVQYKRNFEFNTRTSRREFGNLYYPQEHSKFVTNNINFIRCGSSCRKRRKYLFTVRYPLRTISVTWTESGTVYANTRFAYFRTISIHTITNNQCNVTSKKREFLITENLIHSIYFSNVSKNTCTKSKRHSTSNARLSPTLHKPKIPKIVCPAIAAHAVAAVILQKRSKHEKHDISSNS